MTLRRSLLLGAALLLAILSVGTRAANDTTPPTITIDLPRDGQTFTLHELAVAVSRRLCKSDSFIDGSVLV